METKTFPVNYLELKKEKTKMNQTFLCVITTTMVISLAALIKEKTQEYRFERELDELL